MISMSCHSTSVGRIKAVQGEDRHSVIALAGNANVGKSVIFNRLTDSSQTIGNWPGKTVERAEAVAYFEGEKFIVVDLPGIYSFSTYSLEEIVSREYVALEKPDAVINVLDASVLERNLFFTIQLMEMEAPLVVCINQIDVAKKKGVFTDASKLERILGVPVVTTVAIRGEGIYKLAEVAVKVARSRSKTPAAVNRYSAEVENRIIKLVDLMAHEGLDLGYPLRWVAIKLLENDAEVRKLVSSKSERIVRASDSLAGEISQIHREPCFSVIASERYLIANRIATDVQQQSNVKTTFLDRLDWLATHRIIGYAMSACVVGGLLLWTFTVGGFLSTLLSDAFSLLGPVNPKISGSIPEILWNGMYGGIVAGLTLAIPFVIPFYFMLAIIEDSGILTRVAFMMDSLMHKIGLHGKALIPLILGYGCNVPAIQASRIMETRRERLLAAFAITFAPCTARTIVILGLVAAFVSPAWALALYAIDLVLIFVFGRVALKAVPGKSTGLIMEMHSFKIPSLSVVSRQTWARTKSLMYFVFPIYIVGSAFVQTLYAVGVLEPISNSISFLTVWWLGLPAVAGILLILGAVRKEFILLALVAMYGSTHLTLFLSPVQLITLALIGMLYLPCISTVAILIKEFGWKAAGSISIANVLSAILVGGIAARLISLLF